jgi:hypothetical protein
MKEGAGMVDARTRLGPGLGFLLLLASGCATLQDPIRANLSDANEAVAQCAAWYRALDRRIDRAGVRDGGEYRIPGFPYLRADRFSASFRNEALAGDDLFQAWTGRLLHLDAGARAAELRNLPAGALDDLGVDRAQAGERTQACAATLANELPCEMRLAGPSRRGFPTTM